MKESSLKVLMVSTSFPESPEDWRGRFIANLVAGLGCRQDIDLMLWAPPGELPPRVVNVTTLEEQTWLQNLSRQGGIAHLLRQNKVDAIVAASGLLRRLYITYRSKPIDVAHVNWLQNALPLWGTTTPAVVSVLGTDFGLLRLPGMKYLLRSVFKQRQTILTPNAQWMVPELEHAFGDVAIIHPVPFGVDAPWFAVERRPWEDSERHWLTITRLTEKKIGDLFNWGDGLFRGRRILHLFGPMQETLSLPSWIQYHGPTHPAELLNTWFPKACGLITLSQHDEGRPQVMLEAMAAGLPVIASDLPAHRDIIQHGTTGWITTGRADFADALTELEQSDQNSLIGKAARLWVTQDMGTWDDCATRYAALYTKLLEERM